MIIEFLKEPFLISSYLLLAYMVFWFVVALLKRRNDVADIAWGLGFILLSLFTYFYYGDKSLVPSIVTLLVLIWGVRLAFHIYIRNKKSQKMLGIKSGVKIGGSGFIYVHFFRCLFCRGFCYF